jgi:hypothetical protein
MGAAYVVLILVCSTSFAMPDCSVDTATDVVYGPEANSIFECGYSGQALIASTALGPGLGKDQYLKIICTDRNHIPRTSNAQAARPPSVKDIARELP